MNNELRSFTLSLINTVEDEVVQQSEFIGVNPLHAAFMAGINVGINMMNSPLRGLMGDVYLDSNMSSFLWERDVQIDADNGVRTSEWVKDKLRGKVGGESIEPQAKAVNPDDEFDFEAFLRDLLGE